MTHEATRLAACPFCGGAADGPKRDGGSDERCGYNFRVRIGCRSCGATIFTESHKDRNGWCDDSGQAEKSVIEAWNRRAALAQPAPAAEVALPAVSGETERVAFEAHEVAAGRRLAGVFDQGHPFVGKYKLQDSQDRWEAWLARAQSAVSEQHAACAMAHRWLIAHEWKRDREYFVKIGHCETMGVDVVALIVGAALAARAQSAAKGDAP